MFFISTALLRKSILSLGLISDTLTNAEDCPGASREPGLEAAEPPELPHAAAKPIRTLLLWELRWAEAVTLHPAAASCSSRCKGTLLGARARSKACEGAGDDCEICSQPAVCFLYFCVMVRPLNALANSHGHQQHHIQADPTSLGIC